MHKSLSKQARLITRLHLRVIGARRTGHLTGPNLALPCAIGRSGLTARKREGDGATPRGRLRLVAGRYRRDRLGRAPSGALSFRAIRADDGWCDDPASGRYNAEVKLPFRPGHERLMREDGLYDVVVILDWNLRPRRRSGGSAIFFHCAGPDYRPTAGCLAIARKDMLTLLPRLSPRAEIIVGDGALRPRRR